MKIVRIIGRKKTKEKIKVFVIFDPYHDEDLKRSLNDQAKKRNSPFELVYCSVKKPIDKEKAWKAEVRNKIKNVDQVIVICGEYTDVSNEITVELTIVREEEKPYFLLWGRKGETCEKPREVKHDDKIYEWTRKNLEILLGSTYYIPSVPGVPPVMDKMISKNLVNEFPDKPGYGSDAKYQDHLLEQYKLYVEMANQTSSRRQKTNIFFLSIHTGVIGLFGYFNISNSPSESFNDFWQVDLWFFIMILGLGFALHTFWYRFIRSYGILNDAKFKIINKIEERLPLNLYDTEWEAIGRGAKPKLYFPFTSLEIDTRRILSLLYLYMFIWRVISRYT